MVAGPGKDRWFEYADHGRTDTDQARPNGWRSADCSRMEHASRSLKFGWVMRSSGFSAVQHPELFDVMLCQKCDAPKQIELIVGPPGTGKTRGISERMLTKLSDESPFVGLRCAWTNAAVRNCLDSLLDLAAETSFTLRN